jgi:hypothetical protein
MLLMTLFAVLFSVMRTMGASVGTFAVISTMVAGVAIGQIVLFGGRYPRAASIWVGGCLFPLQFLTGWPLSYIFGTPWTQVRQWGEVLALLLLWVLSLVITVPIGAGFGYLCGGVVGGVFLVLDALAEWRRSHGATVEAAEPPEPTDVVQGREDHKSGSCAP